MALELQLYEDDEAVAVHAANVIAAEANRVIDARGRFTLAVSGGRTPWRMLAVLSERDLPWSAIELFQVDERIAPDGHPDRNWTRIETTFIQRVSLSSRHVHPMPVAEADVEAGATRYSATLEHSAGSPPRIDLVHLGLGADGHTASLIPGDAVLESEAFVDVTAPYQGRRRMTLTLPTLNRAGLVLWVVTGADKKDSLSKLIRQDRSIPAGRITHKRALVVADLPAAAGLDPKNP